jgi:hypothetical protein
MCYTCGCKMPYEDHGDPRNLTEQNLQDAALTKEAGGADITKVKENVAELIDLQRRANEEAQPKQKY